eukprot:Phypoly_transcript_22644.p1 GENE.Phypoly_transcript_22644~~Phypoly_transcript_22644.p1  ORF type:complete len:190 (+),score=32.01 Phypoly_transcript_22644:54-572(+)
MKWEYPIICHPSCLSLLASIMGSIASARNEPSLASITGLEAWDFILSTGSIKRIAMRTRFIDYYMLKTINSSKSPMQVVVLGAGMDTRPFRLPCAPSHYFELDLPSVMDFKRSFFFPSPSPPSSLSSRDEVKTAMSKLGEGVTDAEIDQFIKDTDTNGDGLISFEEFCTLMG